MATQEEIDAVLESFAPGAGAEGWDEARVNAMLDAGMKPDDIALEYWETRMARTSTLVNVSESGSSRSLSDIYTNALKMAEYYRKKKADEDDEVIAKVRGARTRSIRRV